jgi:transcriptional regulator with XRE-family HTH domain
MNQDYAKAFRIIRAAFGLKQTEIAARIGVTPSHLSLIESGDRQPSLRVINSVAAELEIPTVLITLLASSADEITRRPEQDVSDLSRVLLRLLVDAKAEPQRDLELGE